MRVPRIIAISHRAAYDNVRVPVQGGKGSWGSQ